MKTKTDCLFSLYWRKTSVNEDISLLIKFPTHNYIVNSLKCACSSMSDCLKKDLGLCLPLQVLSPLKTSMHVNGSHAKMAAYARATMEGSDAFAPRRAKMGACMGERPAQLHFQAVTGTSARMEEYALPYLSTISTLINASALLASQALHATLPLSSHLSPRATCT